jgi:hypothetical protein
MPHVTTIRSNRFKQVTLIIYIYIKNKKLYINIILLII